MPAEILIGILSVVATLAGAIIQRNWRIRRRKLPAHEPLRSGPVYEDASFVALDIAKILDVGAAGGPGAPGVAELTDSYLIRRESDSGNGVIFRYGTSGSLEGTCVSHADSFVASSYNSWHYPTSGVVSVLLPHMAKGSTSRVTNRVTYTGGFDRTDREDFETHIERPSCSLTFILTLSGSRRATLVTGEVQVGERGDLEMVKEEGPVVSHDGRTAYWRVRPAKGKWLPIGARYRISWLWQQSTPATSAAGESGGTNHVRP